MKLNLFIISFIALAFLGGCEGNNNKANETKLGHHSHPTKKSVDAKVIKGQMVIPQQTVLPGNALITVTLADISIAELPDLILAQKYYQVKEKQFVFPFELSYQKDEVRQNAHLALRATVSVDGDLWFVSKAESIVMNDGVTNNIQLVLEPTK
ncbi:YbaY family lipoprotein [Providencia vermicola]|uniref:YbaY family lipoprotein n=2 Tax=Providencia TaxID=586 RepID=A0AAI9I2J6_PROST|nr:MULTISPECIES: YbaY family lipoprotein [Providencia]ELR5037281.1 YbaY family lipoprotein [Providencia stuartii]ELR5292477.1 YbaY family lipoprotein [Providencia stuartii]ELZ5939453.1 YbaY family lipoprotein [Providencia stuartii]MCR4181156.1 YbaY family lipoprotein [Providencia vermicola]MTB41239.1 hypothetical protein [Providencia sp. wls1949]